MHSDEVAGVRPQALCRINAPKRSYSFVTLFWGTCTSNAHPDFRNIPRRADNYKSPAAPVDRLGDDDDIRGTSTFVDVDAESNVKWVWFRFAGKSRVPSSPFYPTALSLASTSSALRFSSLKVGLIMLIIDWQLFSILTCCATPIMPSLLQREKIAKSALRTRLLYARYLSFVNESSWKSARFDDVIFHRSHPWN